jgi:hypothetical protein
VIHLVPETLEIQTRRALTNVSVVGSILPAQAPVAGVVWTAFERRHEKANIRLDISAWAEEIPFALYWPLLVDVWPGYRPLVEVGLTMVLVPYLDHVLKRPAYRFFLRRTGLKLEIGTPISRSPVTFSNILRGQYGESLHCMLSLLSVAPERIGGEFSGFQHRTPEDKRDTDSSVGGDLALGERARWARPKCTPDRHAGHRRSKMGTGT